MNQHTSTRVAPDMKPPPRLLSGAGHRQRVSEDLLLMSFTAEKLRLNGFIGRDLERNEIDLGGTSVMLNGAPCTGLDTTDDEQAESEHLPDPVEHGASPDSQDPRRAGHGRLSRQKRGDEDDLSRVRQEGGDSRVRDHLAAT